MKLRELVEGAWWHDDLASIIQMWSFHAGQHNGGIAAVIFIEAAGWSTHTTRAKHLIHSHGIIFLVVTLVERLEEFSMVLAVMWRFRPNHGGGGVSQWRIRICRFAER